MTFGSLFAGIGGLDLGLERAGMTCAWQVEIDPFCRRVLAKHWPEVPRYEDVRSVGARELAHVDLICGGFPCQDISNAGRRAGIGGGRSGLWSEYARIVRELRPRFVLVENVAALLARGLGRVLGDLAAGGYDAEWDCLPAAAVGAPHRRDRIFVVAYTHFVSGPRQSLAKSKGSMEAEPGRNGKGRPLADAHGAGFESEWRGGVPDDKDAPRRGDADRCGGSVPDATGQRSPRWTAFAGWRSTLELERYRRSVGREQWEAEPALGRVVDGFPGRVDQLRALGNAVVPQVAEFIGRRILEVAA